MSFDFSPESIFVARNWDTVTEIIDAARQLRDEMDQMLASLEEHLRAMQWWSDEWVFVVRESGLVGISRRAWASGDDHLVRICINQFCPANVFGSDPPPYLYVYVTGRRQGLYDGLMEALDETRGMGDIDRRGSSYMLVQKHVAKCLPDGVEHYFGQVRDQILAFFEYYAQMADEWDPIVQQFVEE